jgi:hypothetical protein
LSGPVSQALEADLREQARQHGILVWLDKEGAYTAFADALGARADGGEFAIPVRRFRGSYLELMLGLEGVADGVTRTPLIVHVPGHTEETIAQTPLFEIYRAGHRHRRALATVVREAALGLATPDATEAFLAGEVTIAAADAWLAGLRDARDGNEPDLSPLSPEALFDALLPAGSLAAEAGDPALARSVRRRAAAALGTDESWWRERARTEAASDLATPLAGWALCVEFVHDLRRAPHDERLGVLKALPRPAVVACQKLAAHLRKRHPDVYARIADEYEVDLEREASVASAADLGKIDTFRFEDRVVLAAALDALEGAKFDVAYDYAIERTAEDSFWPTYVRGRQIAWQLVKLAAQLGRAITTNMLLLNDVRGVADAVERYTEDGYAVDTAHRELEQARHQLAHLELEEVTTLRKRLDSLRGTYRAWADAVAGTFNALCRTEGFLPAPELQQRTLFDDVVAPAAKQTPIAYFMVDGLRFEMGKQLARSLDSKTADVVVKARLAELPTVTEVGMNVLAPVARNGALAIDLKDQRILGFRAGSARVDSPKARHKAIAERIGAPTCPFLTLEELLDRDATSIKKAIARAELIVVHSEGIDKAGEKGVGLAVFDRELQNLRAAWRLLYEAGVRQFVFTADHGFLLHDEATRAPKPHGKQTDPQRRHVITDQRRDQTGEVTVASTDLGYEGQPFFITFPETTAPFDRGDRAKDFVHGGNSLQERVIPVVMVKQRHAAGGESASYLVQAQPGVAVAGMHCLRVKLVVGSQAQLSYGSRAEIELALEAVEGTDVAVEVCDVHSARFANGAIYATLDHELTVYFRLSGNVEERVPIRVRHATRSAAVQPFVTDERFQVVLRTRAPAALPLTPTPAAPPAWLDALPDGVREVFRHIADHGTINEAEATKLLGGPRQFRNFSLHLDEYRRRAPFAVRIDTSAGIKSYLKGERDD